VWASQQARGLGHHWFGGEHLLLALSQEPSIARDVLGELGVTHERLREALQPVVGSEDSATGEQPHRREPCPVCRSMTSRGARSAWRPGWAPSRCDRSMCCWRSRGARTALLPSC
jgi:ATP-dependent Clp protease ATP-binding subunit ClpA